jgi:hypothetical protein
MNIDNLIIKFNSEYEELGNRKHKLDQNKDAEYWLLLGSRESLANCIVDIIEEYSKENELNDLQKLNLKIYKIPTS